jgi:hypothetical protein
MLDPYVPKKGCETEYLRLKKKLAALSQDNKLTEPQRELFKQELEAEFEKVALSPFEVIGAPRVGVDEKATEWFRKNVFQDAQLRVGQEKALPKSRRNQRFLDNWDRPFDDILRANTGKYVAELAPAQEGVSSIRGMLCSPVDFRGAVVGSSECLPQELQNRAYQDHRPGEALEYAEQLAAALTNVSGEHVHEVLDLRSAVRWLRFWGSRGFGFSAWY